MNNDAVTTLQHYAPGMYKVLADIVMTTFLFGCLTVLSIVSACHLIRRGIKQPSTAFMLGSLFLLYASTAIDFAVKTTYVVGHGRLLNDAVTALESMSPSSTEAALIQFGQRARTESYIIGAVIAINITLGDVIVWWRVCVLWRKRSIMALGLVLIVSTFVLGTLSTIHFQVNVEVQPLLSYGDTYGGISGLLSFITNPGKRANRRNPVYHHRRLMTQRVRRKEHRKILRQGPGASNGRWNTPTMRVLILLVESGTIYSVLFSAAVVNNIMLHFKSSLAPSAVEYLSLATVFFTGCFVPILAMCPTFIIFIVALNGSQIEGSLVNASPSDISTAMLPSLLFRGSSTAIHLSPSTDHSADSPENQSAEEPRAQEKPEEACHLV
ncbi:hypothetical protein LXA43DRAFT_1061837 [Ganoderma leucocontextum]|nr:hypothetical protein LXA43DRAFT_1061837 [Ganoderma leucocontextum]